MNPKIASIAGTITMIVALPIAVLVLSLEPGARTHRQEADAAAAQSAAIQQREDDAMAVLDADIARLDLGLDDFLHLETGMSYADAVTILGFEGTLVSELTISGTTTAMYSWTADCCSPGAIVSLMFQNGRLISKTQVGLA